MKKYVTGLVAVMLAISAFALPRLSSKNVDYYWYKRTGSGTYVSNGQGPEPNVSCSGSTKICAKGFLNSQTESLITDATVADAQRTKD